MDKYILGLELTTEEQAQVKAGIQALANGGEFVGCGQQQGFNLLDWIITPAYAYETSCSIRQHDGSLIELGIKTYQECKDAIYAYLNSLSPAQRVAVLRSAGFAIGSSNAPDMELGQMDQWLFAAIEDLDGQPRGENFRQFLEGNAEGYAFAEKMGAERWAIWDNASLTWSQKVDALAKTGLDVNTIVAMAILGGAGFGRSQIAGKAIDDLLKPNGSFVGFVKKGATDNIRTVSASEFAAIQTELLAGAKQVGTYSKGAGTWYELPNGGKVGVRVSDKSGVTLDIDIPGYPKGFKVHQE